MRSFRLFVGLTIIGAQIAAVATGCGDDEKKAGPTTEADASGGDGSTNPGNDASGGGDAKSDGTATTDAEAPTVTANAGDLNVYLGQIAQLDASGSTVTPQQPLGYQWTVVSAPAGSAIVTSSIFNAGSARPSFTPDVIGDYTLKVVVSAGTTTQEKNVVVKAHEAKVVYLSHLDAGASGNARIVSLRSAPTHSDGGPQDVQCVRSDGGDPNSTATTDQLAQWYADLWEGAPGQPSRAAWIMREFLPDGGDRSRMFAATSDQTCATPGTVIRELPMQSVVRNNPFGGGTTTYKSNRYMQPAISPNGARVAYLRGVDSENNTIETVGFDGSDVRVLSSAVGAPDGGLADASIGPGSGQMTRPRWKNDTQVGFLTFPNATKWNVMLADDAANATASVYMTCTNANEGGSAPTQFAFLPDGSVLVSLRRAMNDAGQAGPQDLVIFTPDPTTKACTMVRNVTATPYTDAGVPMSDDFSVSPDGKLVAYVHYDATFDGGPGTTANSIWMASLDGLTPPTPLADAPKVDAVRGHGPRWIAGGAMLTWSQMTKSVSADGGGIGESVVVSSAGGGDLRIVERTTAARSVRAIGNGMSCNVAMGGGSGLVAVGAIGAFVSLLVRRARKNRK